jgi:polyisoprenoid-binding protein YceI
VIKSLRFLVSTTRLLSPGVAGFLLAAGALGLSAGQADAAEYKIDPAHSEVVFKVRHMGLSTVTGRFDKFDGSFDVDPKNVKATKGSLVIETASINTNNAKRDDHLRSKDFFSADKNPQIKYVSKEVKDVNEKDSTATLVGDLTMNGITKPVALKVKGGGIIQDGWGNERAAFTATGKLNRYDWGIKFNNIIEAGRVGISEDVELALSFQGTRPSPKAAAAPATAKEGQKKTADAEAKPAKK